MTKAAYAVVLTRAAESDLVHIAEWYVERHPAGEERFVRDFARARDLIVRNPRIGGERDDLRERLRSWPVYPFIIFYDVDDTSRRVTIVRVIHGHMDIAADDFDG